VDGGGWREGGEWMVVRVRVLTYSEYVEVVFGI